MEEKLDVETHGGDDGTKKGQFVAGLGKPSSGKSSRLLQHLNTRISIGTEDGQFVYVDWLPQKDADSSKLTCKHSIKSNKKTKTIILLIFCFVFVRSVKSRVVRVTA